MKLSPVFTSIALALTCSSTSVLAKDFILIETFPEWFKTAMSRSIDVTKESDCGGTECRKCSDYCDYFDV